MSDEMILARLIAWFRIGHLNSCRWLCGEKLEHLMRTNMNSSTSLVGSVVLHGSRLSLLACVGLAITACVSTSAIAATGTDDSLNAQYNAPATLRYAQAVDAPKASADFPAPASMGKLQEQAIPAFGAGGSRWWILGGGVSNNFSDGTDYNIFGAYSYFLIDDVEFSTELGAWYYAINGDDAQGINPNIVIRWHFYNDGDWTVYADTGIGLAFSTDDVPADGTSVNFTPRVGVGITKALDDSGTRLMVGVRWAHMSNARIFGDGDNPSRDSAMLYAGVIFPF